MPFIYIISVFLRKNCVKFDFSNRIFMVKNKINVANHENSKWHPNSRRTSKRFYCLKLANNYFCWTFLYQSIFTYCPFFKKHIFLKNSRWQITKLSKYRNWIFSRSPTFLVDQNSFICPSKRLSLFQWVPFRFFWLFALS
jgi:hypothetical protein